MILRLPATTSLIAINLLVFVAMILGHVSPRNPTIDQLIRWGADSGEQVILHHQWWRIVTSAFVHIGFVHLLMNMWALWVIGSLAEVVIGPSLYIGFYFVCAIAGSLTSLYWHPAGVGAGASGAIIGILGVMVSVLKFARLPLPKEVLRSTFRSLVQGAALTLAIGIFGPIDNAAHMGGLICGLLIGMLLSFSRRVDESLRRPLRRMSLIAPLALLVPLAFAVQKHGDPEVRLQQARTEIQTGRYQDAEKSAHLALQRSPDRSDALVILSEALYLQGNTAEASKHLQQLIAQDPRNEYAVNRLAAIELKDGDASRALNLLQQTLPLQPRNAEGQVYLGRALQALNEDKGAIDRYRQAVKINPDLYEAQLALANLYEKNNQPQDALLFYMKAAQLKPGELDPPRGLARVYLTLGQKKQADQAIERIRALEKNGS
jgi:membrane associated rhomboid family serine protease/cytochrome c-type biogenesis protein CcmH/NrfG